MSDRDLTTTRSQVFGDVETGTECRVCGRNVDDGRAKTCSDYCSNLLSAVMGLLNWTTVRRRIIDRDDEMCQECGYDQARERRARDHIRERIESFAGPRPDAPSMLAYGRGEVSDAAAARSRTAHRAWRRAKALAKARYGDPYDRARDLEVDHITRLADGGHPFDPGNLRTLCSECHRQKTAEENSGQQTPSRADLNESLFEYVSEGES